MRKRDRRACSESVGLRHPSRSEIFASREGTCRHYSVRGGLLFSAVGVGKTPQVSRTGERRSRRHEDEQLHHAPQVNTYDDFQTCSFLCRRTTLLGCCARDAKRKLFSRPRSACQASTLQVLQSQTGFPHCGADKIPVTMLAAVHRGNHPVSLVPPESVSINGRVRKIARHAPYVPPNGLREVP